MLRGMARQTDLPVDSDPQLEILTPPYASYVVVLPADCIGVIGAVLLVQYMTKEPTQLASRA